jgi:uncharacterized membrane protein YeaQ/YmgE (transglycosylase-associated protein family)
MQYPSRRAGAVWTWGGDALCCASPPSCSSLITINVGDMHLAIYLSQVMYLLVAALVGFVAEFIVGWRLPFGIIGAIIAALVGIWIVTNVIILIIPGDPILFGIPFFKALIGATLFTALWYLLTYRL